MKKRIIHLITNLKTGGAQKMLLQTIPVLNEDFENIIVYVKNNNDFLDEIKNKKIKTICLNLKSIFDFPIFLRFYKILKKEKPDIAINYLIHSDIFGRIIEKIAGTKIIISSIRDNTLKYNFFLFLLDGATSLIPNYFHFNSKEIKNIYKKYFKIKEERTLYIPNGIKISKFDISIDKKIKKIELNLPENKIILGCISRLDKKKGLLDLARAFSIVKKNTDNVILLIVGEGTEKEKIENEITKLCLNKDVFLLGKRDDIPEILDIIDIFCLPTYFEGMSNALLEAMAAKKAIITTAINENKEILKDTYSALLSPPGDIYSLAKNIKKALKDENLKKRLAENAYKEVLKNNNIDNINKKFIALIKSLITK